MASILKVDTIQDQSGNNIINENADTITIGASGDTITIPTGATLDLSNATQTGVGGVNTPAFLATMTTDQTIAHNTNVKMQFSSEVFDTDSCYDNVTNYRFTPTVAGKYYVTLYIFVNSQAQGNLRIMIPKLFKNGSQEFISGGDFATGYQNNATYGVSGLVEMNGTTDYLEGFIFHFTQDGTTSLAGNSNSKFSAFKIIE